MRGRRTAGKITRWPGILAVRHLCGSTEAASRKLTVTPAQMAAPVQLEALPVAVRSAVGESVARQEIWSPRAALGQSLRLIQLLTLRTLLCSRGGHANISRIKRNENLRAASVGG